MATQVAAANVLWDAGEGDPTEKRGAMGCHTIGDRMVNVGRGNYIGIRAILHRFMLGRGLSLPKSQIEDLQTYSPPQS